MDANKQTKKKSVYIYIASGFVDDCKRLMSAFLEGGDLRFSAFSALWKSMKMSLIFHGRASVAEILEFTEETLILVKKYFFLEYRDDMPKRIFGLYLIYALYYLQPCSKFASVMLIKSEAPSVFEFKQKLKMSKNWDALYILCKMLAEGAFHFCLSEREYAFERSRRKYYEGGLWMMLHDRMQSQSSDLNNVLGEWKAESQTSKAKEMDLTKGVEDLDKQYDLASLNKKLNIYHKIKCKVSGNDAMEPGPELSFVDKKLAENLAAALKALSVQPNPGPNEESTGQRRRRLKKKAFGQNSLCKNRTLAKRLKRTEDLDEAQPEKS